jgi:hypothetical protein
MIEGTSNHLHFDLMAPDFMGRLSKSGEMSSLLQIQERTKKFYGLNAEADIKAAFPTEARQLPADLRSRLEPLDVGGARLLPRAASFRVEGIPIDEISYHVRKSSPEVLLVLSVSLQTSVSPDFLEKALRVTSEARELLLQESKSEA